MIGCENLTDNAVGALTKHCRGLTCVALNISNLTDGAVVALAEHCHGLTSVDFRGC
eukprot:CAMPEP_0171940552 /NCGR_PEP_ID=MMETSP0993-20121228/37169_1 /TAXON_ID=483369 /ORGANISM="non described non described, Strain CCMP2098" /LENGTH=55 /DNA_ID=CAMNT_0012582619 /DNA_START=51 /DNA_END=215 /DNA_ORIENTATION=+